MSASTGVTWWDAELHRIGAIVIRAEGGGDTVVREALSRAVAIAKDKDPKPSAAVPPPTSRRSTHP
jgi:hypothetical protein